MQIIVGESDPVGTGELKNTPSLRTWDVEKAPRGFPKKRTGWRRGKDQEKNGNGNKPK